MKFEKALEILKNLENVLGEFLKLSKTLREFQKVSEESIGHFATVSWPPSQMGRVVRRAC